MILLCVLRKLYPKINNSVDPEKNPKVVKITCYDERFAIKLFQVLNNRGMDLSAADIIKGYLLVPINRDEHKHAVFMNDWRVIEQWISDMDNVNLTDMFTYYQYYLLASNPKHSLVEELKRQFLVHTMEHLLPYISHYGPACEICRNG
jgi:uncharacterized protein with ParB-like and HNH nuclease domain